MRSELNVHRHVDDQLYSFLLNTLTERENNGVLAHLSRCVRCTGRLAQASDDLALLSLALPPTPVPPWIREGVAHALGELHRFADLTALLSHHLCLEGPLLSADLFRLDNPAAWDRTNLPQVDRLSGGSPGVVWLRTQAGHCLGWPKATASKLPPSNPLASLTPPLKIQLGQTAPVEILVIQGSCRTVRGEIFTSGDLVELGASPLRALTGPDVLYAAACPSELGAA